MSYTIVIGHVITYLKCEVCKNYFFSETHYNTHPCALSKIEPTEDEIEECRYIDSVCEPPKIIELGTPQPPKPMRPKRCEPKIIELGTPQPPKPMRPKRKRIIINPPCPECNGVTQKHGIVMTRKKGRRQKYLCNECGRKFTLSYVHPDISTGKMEITGVKAQ